MTSNCLRILAILKPNEQSFATHDLEVAAIVFAMNNWRKYLNGEKLEIYLGHKSLKFIFNRKELNMWQRRWLELLKEYGFKIEYHPGRANVVVDA